MGTLGPNPWPLGQLLWPHLDSGARKAVRASCRAARFMHDQLCHGLSMRLGRNAPSLRDLERTLAKLTRSSPKLTSLIIHQMHDGKADERKT